MSKLLKLGWTLWLLATLTGCVPTPTPPPLITLEVLPTPTPTRALGGPNAIVLALPPGLTAPEKLNSAHYLADQISRQTGLSVTVTVLASYAAVIDGMEQGTVHMAWLPPFAYMAAQERGAATVTLLSERFGATRRPVQFIANANWLQVRYTPTPTRTPRPTRTPTPTLTPTGQPSVTGTPTPVITQTAVPTPLPTRTPIPVFLTNEHLETLQRLAGYRPCWSARTSASYIMPAGIFALAGIRTQPGKFLANDEAVVEAVYNSPNGEQCDFGVTVMDAHLDSRLTDVATQVQVVYFSGPIIPFENVAFASTLTQAQQDRLTNVWLAIAETTLGRRALKDVFNVDGLERGDDSLYDSFRSYLEASGAEPETLIE